MCVCYRSISEVNKKQFFAQVLCSSHNCFTFTQPPHTHGRGRTYMRAHEITLFWFFALPLSRCYFNVSFRFSVKKISFLRSFSFSFLSDFVIYDEEPHTQICSFNFVESFGEGKQSVVSSVVSVYTLQSLRLQIG